MSIIYRYGVSMLSRKNHSRALPEELLIDKETGQILLKQENGKIISYDSSSRFKSSVDNLILTTEKQIFLGKLYACHPSVDPLPRCMNSGDTLLTAEPVLLGSIKKLLIQLDVDVLDTSSLFGDMKEFDKVLAEVVLTRNERDITIKMPVMQLNEKVISYDTATDTVLKSIKIVNETVDDNNRSQYILHNILLVVV